MYVLPGIRQGCALGPPFETERILADGSRSVTNTGVVIRRSKYSWQSENELQVPEKLHIPGMSWEQTKYHNKIPTATYTHKCSKSGIDEYRTRDNLVEN